MAMKFTRSPKPGRVPGSRSTGRKRAGEALRESEETLRAVTSSAQDAILMLDNDGNIALWNAAAERMFGYSSREALGKNLHLLLAPGRYQEAHRVGFDRFRSTGEGAAVGKTLELAALRKDGTEFPIDLSLSAVKLKDKWSAIGIVRDITERKRAEEALRRSEKDLNDAQRLARIGSWDWDARTDTITWSDEYYRIYGFDPAQRPPGYQEHLKAYTPESAARLDAAVKRNTQTGESYELELELARTEGPSRWFVARSETKRDAEGQIIGLRGTAQDITERKRAEEDQRAAALYARSLIEASLDPLVTISPAGKITDVSKATEEVTGLGRDHLVGTDFADYFTEPDKARAGYRRVLAEGYVRDYPLTIRHSSGRTTDVLYNATVYRNEAGELQGVFAAARDITERKRAERERLAHLRFVESMNRVHRAMQGANDLEQMMSNALNATFSIFDCDRAWLLYPCDPEAPSFRVPMEITKPEYPGAKVLNVDVPMSAGEAQSMQEALDSDAPVTYTAGTERPVATAKQFGVQSQMFVPVHPKSGKPWVLGMHQCSYPRIWTVEEKSLLQEIGRRLADALTGMLMQRDLRKSEEKYRTIFEESFDGLFVTSPDGRILDMNKKGVAMFGYDSKEEVLRLDLEKDVYAYPPDRKRILAMVDAQGTAEYEVAVKKKGGGTMVTHCALTAVKDEAGAVLSYRGIISDITGKKRAEAMRDQLVALVASSGDGIYGTDLEGILTSWNPGAERIFGYGAEEVIGRPADLLAPADRADEPPRLRQRALRGEKVSDVEAVRRHKDGRLIDVAFTISPVVDAQGKVSGLSVVARDITEKRRAERALRKVNRALKATSDCNMALIHATGEMQLLDAICRIIVDAAGYRLAWVGYAEHDPAKTIRPVAHDGYEPGYMDHTNISWADDELGRGPVGIAIRSGQIQVVQDVMTDPRFEPWRANAIKLGYGSVLVAPLMSGSETIGALCIYAEGADAFDAGEIALLGELASDMAFGIVTLRTRSAHEQSAERIQRSMETTIQVIAGTVEMRDPYTAGHQLRVADLATAIAHKMGLTEERAHGIRLAGMVHDLGKVHVPAEILSKPGKLTPIEFQLIQAHPEAGYEILKGVDFPWPIAQIVYQHHERLDGSGYPRGLMADEILLEARILTVADVVEAMASHRPYRPAQGIEPALEEISANAGKYYDADVVRACIALFREKAFAFKG